MGPMGLTLVQDTYAIKLACGHKAVTTVNMTMQYPDDVHYVRCPSCRKQLTVDSPLFNLDTVPTAWNEVTSVNLCYVPTGLPSVMPRDIMRMQPSVPPNRRFLFKYVIRKR